MAHPNNYSLHVSPVQQTHKFVLEMIIVTLLIFLPQTKSLNFSFSNFKDDGGLIDLYNDSSIDFKGVIQLTRNQRTSDMNSSVGRASYSQPVPLWDETTKEVANFTSHFRFVMNVDDPALAEFSGDGIMFYLIPFDESLAPAPATSYGGCLGLVVRDTIYCNTSSTYPFVGVEFDTYKNNMDPNADHVGIDINSTISKATTLWNSSMKTNATANAWVTYNSATKNLSVYLTYDDKPTFNGQSSLSYIVDLSHILPAKVRVGFSGSTGSRTEIHELYSWDFNSTLSVHHVDTVKKTVKPKSNIGKVLGSTVAVCAMLVGLGLLVYIWLLRRNRESQRNGDIEFDEQDDFEEGTGPKKFTYHELSRATNNFAKKGKLGEGGFGSVYIGVLTDPSRKIAVKQISKDSKQGKKEYASEVKIISKLRHRNLVQLLGWSHEHGDLLLVYEYMPNGSLDSHIYGDQKASLRWALRHKIAQGIASSLLYLHEGWEQCVVHRDIKSSNVMLDSDFNAKLGDFGLARLVDHSLGSQTTMLAGTLGYLAPECVTTGKASKESDVYSFGVVGLEIACGRKPIDFSQETGKVRMVEWVWYLYGKDLLLEAVDKRLDGEFDVEQIKRLMIVSLWCCHPDPTLRPSMRQVLNVLNSDAPLPSLPASFPIPVYVSPFTSMDGFSTTFEFTGSSTATTSSSAQSAVSGTVPLLSQKGDVR